MSESLLESYRVLDLTDEKGFLCGRILGDMGADVIKIEPPGGDSSRNRGPFYHDIPDPNKSLYWFAYNANKKGITLNIETKDGQQIFKSLVKHADFVIESFSPGYLESLGLGYEDLSQINPGLILTSITPFGQTGPYSHYKASDIVSMAMGGLMYLSGDPDRPPVRVSFPQSYLQGAAAAAAGTMTAFYYRQISGEGQQVDVSIQEAVIRATLQPRMFWDVAGRIVERAGQYRTALSALSTQRVVWQCKDGWINFPIFGGVAGARTNRALAQWMESEGVSDKFLLTKDWEAFDMATATEAEIRDIEGRLVKFFMSHTKTELLEGSLNKRIMLYPVFTVEDIVTCAQLKGREFWEEVEHPELATSIIYPGAFIKMSQTPCQIRKRPPIIGEHNDEVYRGEFGFSKGEIAALKQGGVV
ncbi:MAG: CoA transferase [Chloroflexi bacterium CG23_combo_of_CG06-09_8_20_14_all_45_10]|nr:MAG: CoA transferase [Chloroflexi bacterium CG23_combo_of_CG06-09_8_20_14_all_45_10]